MGSFLSRTSENDYEKILQEMEDRIHSLEVAMSEASLRCRKLIAVLTTYSILVYLFWLLSFFFIVWPQLDFYYELKESLKKFLPVVLVPLFIYSIRWIVQTYYKRLLIVQEQELDNLKKKQKQKMEEMKQKMKYYMAKNLIERYEAKTSTPVKQKQDHQQQQQQQLSQSQSGPLKTPVQMTPTPPRMISAPNSHFPSPVPQMMPKQQPNQTKSTDYKRTWLDRVLDVIIGEEVPLDKTAIICEKCFLNVGFLSQNTPQLTFTCPRCRHHNSKSQSTALAVQPSHPSSPVASPIIESKTLLSEDSELRKRLNDSKEDLKSEDIIETKKESKKEA